MSKLFRPARVRIGGQIWRIEFRSRLEDGNLYNDTYGYTLDAGNLIVIDGTTALGKQQTTLIHEILHAARMTYDSTVRPGRKAEFSEIEHYFIGVWEQPLLQIIKDNTEVIAWLTLDEG